MTKSQSVSLPATDLKFKVNVDVQPPEIRHLLAYDEVESWVRYLSGNIYTLIDASFSDPQQRKAVKDLARKQFGEHLRELAIRANLNRSIDLGGGASS